MNPCSPLKFSPHRRLRAALAYGLLLFGFNLLWLLLTTAPAAANSPPTFTSNPFMTATLDSTYRYVITTNDPNPGDVLTLRALEKPSWLTLTSTGAGHATLTGLPAPVDTGVASVVLQVQDSGGLSAVQAYSVTVLTDPWPLGSIAGKVTSGGAGVAGVTVYLSYHCEGMVITCPAALIEATTDAEGHFRFDNLLIGTYTCYIEPTSDFEIPASVELTVKANLITTVPEVTLTRLWWLLFLPTIVQ